MVIRRHRMHGRGGDRRMKKRAIFKCSSFFYMSLYISLYGVNDSFNLMLKYQALIHEMVDLKYVMD
jgi:hypothetical protein